VLGLAYKAGTSALRRSQALELIRRLKPHGAAITAFDPQVRALVGAEFAQVRVCAGSRFEALEGADALAVMTDWPEFRGARRGAREAPHAQPLRDRRVRDGWRPACARCRITRWGSRDETRRQARNRCRRGIGPRRRDRQPLRRRGRRARAGRPPPRRTRSRRRRDHPEGAVPRRASPSAPPISREEDDIARLVETAAGALGGIDILANSAGVNGPFGTVDEVDWPAWRAAFDVNFFGAM
jgi:NAD(P)-dependent dehydrogenase (short-subunit alcohol dehydrogenase family)